MSGISETTGIIILIIGVGLFLVELAHPGALLLIPATILIVGAILYLLIPDVLLDSIYGPIAIVFAAMISTVATIFYYRWLAGTHLPMSTTTRGLIGEEGIVIADIVPNTIHGKVRIHSEVWSARGNTPIPVGTKVRVVAGEGVSLTVESLPDGHHT
jgi:membrane protein implicated in regulation of membrane protease activity